MDDLSPSDLKTILHSKRANMYYLEHCRVMQKRRACVVLGGGETRKPLL